MPVFGKCDECGDWIEQSKLTNVIEKQLGDRLIYKACPDCVEHVRSLREG